MTGDVTLGALKRFTQLLAGQAKNAVSITGGAIDGTPIGATTPTPVIGTNIRATGNYKRSIATPLTAVGTNRATSLALTADVNNITTAASGTGATLPASSAGLCIINFNSGANAIQIYGAGSDTIDGVAGATGVPLTNTKRCLYICVAANTWISAQLGVVSA